ncbi:hypothetical protein EVAR_9628_1 [Eumeta japonica]|uniref:Uncharacterized protein n=1 Tax=Eumeta variegata TaxID=151549 RepID=A0A4C1TKZ6_EUMVA|nr:hypothetical protein EVAR_9628_1 [Eumeta japonica]
MKSFIIFFAAICASQCREIALQSDVDTSPTEAPKQKEALGIPCTLSMFRTLESGSSPSVIVKWQGRNIRLTHNRDGTMSYEGDYRRTTSSHSYPPSSGYSGSADVDTATTADPFADSPVVPDTYSLPDIIVWFQSDCKHVYRNF